MSLDLFSWDLVFRFSIFSLLAYKIYSLTKTYALPFIFDQMALEQNQQMEIAEKEKLLVSTQNRIENQIFNQKQMLTLLEKNIQVWHKSELEEKDAQEKENKQLIGLIQEKRGKQKKVLILDLEIRHTIPQALALATQQLHQNFDGPDGKKLLNELIAKL